MSNYTIEEVRVLVEVFSELSSIRARKLWILVRLCDIVQTMKRLSPGERTVLFLCGMCGLGQDKAAAYLGIDQGTVSRRFADALVNLHYYINRKDNYAIEPGGSTSVTGQGLEQLQGGLRTRSPRENYTQHHEGYQEQKFLR